MPSLHTQVKKAYKAMREKDNYLTFIALAECNLTEEELAAWLEVRLVNAHD